MYDVIVVGARAAGAATAMLLARKGYGVLLVDRATFPSDTPTGHYIHQAGVAHLARWDLIDRVIASGCPPARSTTLDVGPFALTGSPPATADGTEMAYAPRQLVLTQILVDAAVEAGAELREGFSVQDLRFDGDRVTGIRGRARNGREVTEQARLVVGADGRHSRVARIVQAPSHHERPSLTGGWWSYWSGVPASGITIHLRPNRALGTFATNDGLTGVFTTVPAAEVERFRSDIATSFDRDLDLVPALAEQVHAGRREEPFYGAADIPNRLRKPYGPGWALVGDAGYHKDPITAQGITDAFRDAELLADAIDGGFSAERPLTRAPGLESLLRGAWETMHGSVLEACLGGYERRRNEAALPMYDLTCGLATLAPPPEMQQLLAALAHNQPDTDRFFGTLAGTVPISEFFAPENVQRILAAAGQVDTAA